MATHNVFMETSRVLAAHAAIRDDVIVAFSGGKDSLTCLDLACRNFKEVVCFFMYFVPGMRCIEERLAIASERYHCKVLMYPHWNVINALKYSFFRPAWYDNEYLPDFKLQDIHKLVIEETGIDLIIHGGKRSDSTWRRRMMKATEKDKTIIYPIKNWNKWDVMAYLARNNLNVHNANANHAGGGDGISLDDSCIFWLYDNYRDDYERVRLLFPYISAIIKRREWYPKKDD